MPDTTTTSSNEADFDHSGLDWIITAYDEEFTEGMEGGDAFKRHDLVSKWYKWCDRQYPDASSQDWAGKVDEAGEHVDIRVLIRGQPIAGYSILRFLEACYAVDKALCGTDAEAFAEVRSWHMPEEMSAYNYLLSGDMIQWWVKELAELENEIESSSSNLISLTWKIMDLGRCLTRLEAVVESGSGIGTNIWTTMEEENGSVPPAGTFGAIFDREQGLKDSLGILRKALERRKQRDATSDVPPTTSSHGYVESTGIRRRIPRAASLVSENDPREVQTDSDTTENHTVTTERVTRAPDAPPPTWINTYQKATLMFRLAMGLVNTSATRYRANGRERVPHGYVSYPRHIADHELV
ncbi:hypothetical protein V502_03480 [Pseudogymnoascus sp. VKM F-4520 (FW-2644)]|nr:hypothetical protein V502_03480 [Pseudogymnoascus sp. VKM F-4520 (FW-2644)]